MSVDVKYRTSAIASGGRDGKARAEDGRRMQWRSFDI